MRGDHPQSGEQLQLTLGPTPHARGPQARRNARRRPGGTNPACAGTTTPRPAPARRPRDQPRMRGEPLGDDVYVTVHNGTNPACAGTTRPSTAPRSFCGDQPRMRGDHTMAAMSGPTCTGPTPHARGPQSWARSPMYLVGTNPACAGTTRWPPCRGRLARDQPRMRGDHRAGLGPRCTWSGPTPHARGPQHQRVSVPAQSGPTPHARGPRRAAVAGVRRPGTNPACAGTTCPVRRSSTR